MTDPTPATKRLSLERPADLVDAVEAAAIERNRSRLASSAGKNDSTPISSRVTSRGAPKTEST